MMFNLVVTTFVLVLTAQCYVARLRCPFASSFNDGNDDVDAEDGVSVSCASAPDDCPDSNYRSFDGSCNNLKNRNWGMANSRYGRLLLPKYADNVSTPTIAFSGGELPSARAVSNVVFLEDNIPDSNYTIINMQWGQVVAHDISLIAGSSKSIRNAHQCCSAKGKLRPVQKANCYPIMIPKNDSYYAKYKVECQDFVRTVTDHDAKCDCLGPYAEQINIVTSFLDLSTLYGVDEKTSNGIRTFKNGRLQVDRRKGYDWLPAEEDNYDVCDISSPDERCYRGGDLRINQNMGLTLMAITHMREHNRLADQLNDINPHWSDERIFQEARRINIAEYQHITYYEWLPILLSKEKLLHYKLIYANSKKGYISDYDDTVNPMALNENANAAFRYYHSQIEGHLKLLHRDGSCNETLRLSDFFYKPSVIEQDHNFDGLFYGFVSQPQQQTDFNYHPEIRDFWNRFSRPFGDDLRSVDIQRNRDHGLATYNDYRELYGKPRATKWEDFLDTMKPRFVNLLKSVYESFEDIDLTVGTSSEFHEDNTLGGPLLNLIMLEQFYRVRVGDRFFYENGRDKDIRFTKEQLRQIRKSSVSRLFCDNSNNNFRAQRAGFEVVSEKNKVVKCSNLPRVNLSAWKEEPPVDETDEPHMGIGADLVKWLVE